MADSHLLQAECKSYVIKSYPMLRERHSKEDLLLLLGPEMERLEVRCKHLYCYYHNQCALAPLHHNLHPEMQGNTSSTSRAALATQAGLTARQDWAAGPGRCWGEHWRIRCRLAFNAEEIMAACKRKAGSQGLLITTQKHDL